MKKRILSILLTLCMVLSLMPAAAFGDGADITGTGAEDDPYLIYTAEGLKQFRDAVNGGHGGAHARLMADIVLNDGTFDENGNWSEDGTPDQWTPIGGGYCGTFDGDGYTIRGLYVKGAGYAGLFGTVYGGTIKNVTVTGYVEGTQYAGGIAGYVQSATVSGCTNAATVKAKRDGSFVYVGGIVGYLFWEGTVRSCTNLGSVWAQIDSDQGEAQVGGIAGYLYERATVADCYNAGSIAIQDSGTGECEVSHLGGIAGSATWALEPSYISNCYSVGSLTYRGSASAAIWGIVGYNVGLFITNCYWLEGTAESGVGGDPRRVTNTSAHTKSEFADGTVLALLKGDRTDSPWADECRYVAAAGMTLPVFKGQSGDAHTCTYQWQHNDTEHWKQCACGLMEADSTAAHSPETGVCTQGIFCECGYEMIPAANGHDWTAWQHQTTSHTRSCQNPHCGITESGNCTGGTATCTNPAVCEVCGQPYGPLDPDNHMGGVLLVGAKAATCTEDGYTGDEVCASCDEIITKGKTIPAIGHKTELVGAKEATCTEDGYTGDQVCKTCGETVTKGKAIKATGHDYKDGKCTECGETDPDYKPAEPVQPENPGVKTGDEAHTALWLAAASVSLLAAALLLGKKKHLN